MTIQTGYNYLHNNGGGTWKVVDYDYDDKLYTVTQGAATKYLGAGEIMYNFTLLEESL